MDLEGISIANRVRQAFEVRYDDSPAWVVRAPGRVNLIGEHTDYNQGFVLPMAIDREIWIALRPHDDREVRLWSQHFESEARFELDRFEAQLKGWAGYVQGLAREMAAAGMALAGWEGVIESDLPIGAGLSSSAALTLAAGRAHAQASELAWDPVAMAKLAQQAENKWVGVQTGIMDQFASALGKKGHALLIDCQSLEERPVLLPREVAVVVLDTGTRRDLVDTAYNQRRRECEAVAEHFGLASLRELDPGVLEAAVRELPEVLYRRARHVLTENARVLAAVDSLEFGSTRSLGKLMSASHRSLRDDFEVSSVALEAIVNCALQQEACLGARLTGAGFAGCAIALVQADGVGAFSQALRDCYHQSAGLEPQIIVCEAAPGVSLDL
jgi:galactokinase